MQRGNSTREFRKLSLGNIDLLASPWTSLPNSFPIFSSLHSKSQQWLCQDANMNISPSCETSSSLCSGFAPYVRFTQNHEKQWNYIIWLRSLEGNWNGQWIERGGRSSLENKAQFPYVGCKLVSNSNQNCITKSQMVKSLWAESTKSEDILLWWMMH
jgi:hypothetical protein